MLLKTRPQRYEKSLTWAKKTILFNTKFLVYSGFALFLAVDWNANGKQGC